MIDLHCDTVSKLASVFHRGNLMHNPYSVDVERLEKAGALMQCFSTFFDVGKYGTAKRDEKAYVTANHMIDVFEKNLKECHDKVVFVKKYEDIQQCMDTGRIGALLTLEDGTPVGNSLEKLQHFYNRGIRLITLTWNYENEIGYPNSLDQGVMSSGLKSFGFQALEEMNRLGIIVDVSHLSDGGFWDVARHSQKPFIASHSNARSITVHPRNLTDTMITAIAEKGGVIGLNLCPDFLGTDGKSSISHMLYHIKHIYQVGGEDVLALGTDFDGIEGKLQIRSCDELCKLREALLQHKMPERVVDKMWQGNALRVMKDIL
nr:dipeptidase [uncultured Blautia sp.]